ncbi:MAG: fatty acyl-AMP ligase [Myxococcales bacterium]|nr:fatty acyl-AMP ligase [Myxococcales bacterium]
MRLIGPPLPPLRAQTFVEALRLSASSPFHLTFIDAREAETRLDYGALYRHARQLAHALAERGVQPGDRVALVLPTGPDFVEAFFAVQFAGAVPVPLYPPVRLGRMEEYVKATARMLNVVGARMVLSDARVKLLLGQAIALASVSLGCPTVSELRGGRGELERQAAPDSLGVIQFSSGSTVDPKAVALSHGALTAQCAALESLMRNPDITQPVGVSWLPLYHDMGLIGCLLSGVYQAGPLALLPPEAFLVKPALWLRAISKHRATISPAPNFAYGLCLKRVRPVDLDGVDLSRWAYALNGAEPVSADTLTRFGRRFAPQGFRREALMPVYGMSEASLAVTFTSPRGEKRALSIDPVALASRGAVEPPDAHANTPPRTLVSVGTPVPGAELEVRDAAGTALGERQQGRIFVRGPFVMAGYFNDAEATARALPGGWLDTGDLGFLDGGELFICGRAKDVVIVRGRNHAPQEFEDALEAVEGVRLGCAVAVGFVPPEGGDEQLLLLVETSGEATADLKVRVEAAVLARTGVRSHTVMLLEPGTLPRTSSGKLRRGEALRRHQSAGLTPPRKVNALSMTREFARSALGYAKAALE